MTLCIARTTEAREVLTDVDIRVELLAHRTDRNHTTCRFEISEQRTIALHGATVDQNSQKKRATYFERRDRTRPANNHTKRFRQASHSHLAIMTISRQARLTTETYCFLTTPSWSNLPYLLAFRAKTIEFKSPSPESGGLLRPIGLLRA